MKYSCEELVRKMNLKPLQLLALSVYSLRENIRNDNKTINKWRNRMSKINLKLLQLLGLSVYSLKENIRKNNKIINKSYN